MSEGEKRHVTLEDLQEQMSGIEVMVEELRALVDKPAMRSRYTDISYTRLACGCAHIRDALNGPFDLICKSCFERIAAERNR